MFSCFTLKCRRVCFLVLGRWRFFGLGLGFEVHLVSSKIGNRMIRSIEGVVEIVFLDGGGGRFSSF